MPQPILIIITKTLILSILSILLFIITKFKQYPTTTTTIHIHPILGTDIEILHIENVCILLGESSDVEPNFIGFIDNNNNNLEEQIKLQLINRIHWQYQPSTHWQQHITRNQIQHQHFYYHNHQPKQTNNYYSCLFNLFSLKITSTNNNIPIIQSFLQHDLQPCNSQHDWCCFISERLFGGSEITNLNNQEQQHQLPKQNSCYKHLWMTQSSTNTINVIPTQHLNKMHHDIIIGNNNHQPSINFWRSHPRRRPRTRRRNLLLITQTNQPEKTITWTNYVDFLHEYYLKFFKVSHRTEIGSVVILDENKLNTFSPWNQARIFNRADIIIIFPFIESSSLSLSNLIFVENFTAIVEIFNHDCNNNNHVVDHTRNNEFNLPYQLGMKVVEYHSCQESMTNPLLLTINGTELFTFMHKNGVFEHLDEMKSVT
jgi:hypothetical protein